MAQVVLLSATPAEAQAPENLAVLRDLQASAEQDAFKVHWLTTDAEAADLILFAESYGAGWFFERVRSHPLVEQYPEKSFLVCSNPFVIPLLPGIYTGLHRRWSSRRTISGFHLGVMKNEFSTYTPPTSDLPYLYSFMGSAGTAAVRRRLTNVTHPRSFFQDTSADFDRALHSRMDVREARDYRRRCAELTKASKFVLCPRGLSVSSIRLFETMRMGRVPVIVSDGWREPPGPQWKSFSIRVRERKCGQIPRILEERESESVRMGKMAREEWLQWFSEEAAFHRVVEWCLQIKRRRMLPERVGRLPAHLQYLRPFHLRRLVSERLRSARA